MAYDTGRVTRLAFGHNPWRNEAECIIEVELTNGQGVRTFVGYAEMAATMRDFIDQGLTYSFGFTQLSSQVSEFYGEIYSVERVTSIR